MRRHPSNHILTRNRFVSISSEPAEHAEDGTARAFEILVPQCRAVRTGGLNAKSARDNFHASRHGRIRS
jgi:hypothetical protein